MCFSGHHCCIATVKAMHRLSHGSMCSARPWEQTPSRVGSMIQKWGGKKKTLSCNSRAPSVSFSWSLALLTVAYNLHRLGSSTFKESEQEAGGLLQRCHRQSVISPACLCPAFTSSENVVHLVALKILNSNCICKGIPGSCYSSGVTYWSVPLPPFHCPPRQPKRSLLSSRNPIPSPHWLGAIDGWKEEVPWPIRRVRRRVTVRRGEKLGRGRGGGGERWMFARTPTN